MNKVYIINRTRVVPYNGSFEKNGRRAFYLSHHANPPRAEANERMSAPRTSACMHTSHSAGRMRTRAAFRTSPAHCNTCAHFCQLGTQNVSPLFSAQLAPCMRRAQPTALVTRLAQATPFSALELSTGGPLGNLFAACNAHKVVALFPQPLARAGRDAAPRRSNTNYHPPRQWARP